MPLDPDRLMAYRIPDIHQVVTPRDVVFYALSVGFGCDPMDGAALGFVDADRDLQVAPTMAAVLGYPGFWLGNPATGVDAGKLVHGEQTITVHAPLPTHGEVIGRTRVTGLVDKGAGRGALLYSEKALTDAATGAPLATTRSTTVLRGDGGFGRSFGPPPPPPHTMPEGPPDTVVTLPTRPDQALYYRLNGDDNPLHSDPAAAARAGFARPILHGLCTMGVVGHAVLRGLCAYQTGRLREMALRFAAPVYPGETIRTEMWRDGSFRAIVPERDVVVINNGRAVVG